MIDTTTMCRPRPLLPLLTMIFVSGVLICAHKSRIPEKELDPEYWLKTGQAELDWALRQEVSKEEAKNVILFLGDGMGVSTVTAARILKGQRQGRPGEEEVLSFERLPNVAMVKTYNVDHQIPDSAATATAFLCGVKAKFGTVGLDPRAKRGHCKLSKGTNTSCILEQFQKAGKATGIVTTSRITHATPAPLYASSPDRKWEDDTCLPHSARQYGCRDVAAQIVDSPGKDINVVFGGGRQHLLPQSQRDPEYVDKWGQRKDGRNLVEEWLGHQTKRGRNAQYVWSGKELEQVSDDVDHVMGLFEPSYMRFEAERNLDPGREPSLAKLTEKAIRILDRKRTGYFLLVEGGRIDHAHHANAARVALEETLALEEAVTRTLDLVDLEDTLVIVTADHSHPLSIGSYSTRGNPILGLADFTDESGKNVSDEDNLPYTTLNYANGPGHDHSWPRKNLTNVNTESYSYRQASVVPLKVVTHDGSDVSLYAAGPWAHLFQTTHEQHYIYHVMSYASCTHLGSANHAHCSRKNPQHMSINRGPLYRVGGQHSVDPTSVAPSLGVRTQHTTMISGLILVVVITLYLKSNINLLLT